MRDTLLTRGCDIPRGTVGGWTGGACRGAEDAGVGQDRAGFGTLLEGTVATVAERYLVRLLLVVLVL